MFLYDISASGSMFHFNIVFFLWTWSFSMPFSTMASPRYYDIAHFLNDLNENGTAYVKLKIRHFVRENFLIFKIFIDKITINYKIHVKLSSFPTPPPSPLGCPLGWVLLGTHYHWKIPGCVNYFDNIKCLIKHYKRYNDVIWYYICY